MEECGSVWGQQEATGKHGTGKKDTIMDSQSDVCIFRSFGKLLLSQGLRASSVPESSALVLTLYMPHAPKSEGWVLGWRQDEIKKLRSTIGTLKASLSSCQQAEAARASEATEYLEKVRSLGF